MTYCTEEPNLDNWESIQYAPKDGVLVDVYFPLQTKMTAAGILENVYFGVAKEETTDFFEDHVEAWRDSESNQIICTPPYWRNTIFRKALK